MEKTRCVWRSYEIKEGPRAKPCDC